MKIAKQLLVLVMIASFLTSGICTAATLASQPLPVQFATSHVATPASPIVFPSFVGKHAAKPEMPWYLQIRCIIIIIIVINYSARYGGGSEQITSNGSATFDILQSNDVPFSQTLNPVNVSFTGQSQRFGAFTAGFDASRPNTPTTVASVGDAQFPAQGDIFFTPTITLGAFPQTTFTSVQEQHLTNSNLQSYNPQRNERWTLVNDHLDFTDASGAIAFTLTSQTTTIN